MGDIGRSTSELLERNKEPSHLTQYIAAISVITMEQNNWFSSTFNLGALIGGLLGGMCVNTLGRRGTMLASVLPFLGSWMIIAFAQNFAMLVCGRVLAGLCAGVTCIAVPTYIGEFASPDIRGTLGTGFQLMVVVGLEYAYVFGAVMTTWRGMALVCAIPPVIYLFLVFFTKESPTYLLSKGKDKEAKEALQYFRGKHYDVEPEMQLMRKTQEEARQNTVSLSDLKKPYILKPLLISCTLMVFQQLSGVNAVLFNLSLIFEEAGSGLPDDVSSIIVGLVQVVVTAISGILMDKAGRKVLLIISAAAMIVSLVALDVYFYEKFLNEERAVETLSWLPLTCLIIFITAFSIGFGPIPWLMMGELFSLNVRGPASSLATMVNWTMAFLVTLLFQPLQEAIGPYGIYWLFAGFCAISLLFCILVVPETKGKTLQEITRHFGGPVTTEDATKKQEELSRF
ncbi:Facilitated trehalose transporter Tret1-like 19 [Homarus americanus]|uniref:Facilitated trehalose transporter Tret1-like 19 n=1 Tax=Homarus americanus TaxID=6706 RepID=A0A8J5JP54_HOMAM|nr:Facilitated trehalose transporter Tret1-like 19 [Homarus americanus]